jgi:hypothetical protein
MSISTQTDDHPKSVRRLVHWWRDWIRRRAAAAELDRCGPTGVERLAQDLAVGQADLRILAGKWPTHLNLLSRRMEELKLNGAEVARVEPEVARDLQRVCSLCESQRKCRHDLVRNPSAPAWQAYCPNAGTLTALVADRAIRECEGDSKCHLIVTSGEDRLLSRWAFFCGPPATPPSQNRQRNDAA